MNHLPLTLAALLCAAPLTAFAQSTSADAGLPGGPALPSTGTADPGDEATDDEPPSLGEVGLAVAGYLGGLITEDPTITVGTWYAIGNYPGLELKFSTRRLDVHVNQGIGSDAPHRRTIRYEDLIDDKVILEVRQNAERFRGDGFAQTEIAGGYRFRDAPLLPLDARFEVKLFHDDPSQTSYDRYRAVLQTVSPLAWANEDNALFVKHSVRLGLERASISGHGATRAVLGNRLEAGIGSPDVTDGFFKFHVDVEIARGAYDAGGGSSVGFNNALGMSFGSYDNWTVGLETSNTHERVGGLLFGRTDQRLKIRRYTIDGEFALSPDVSLDAKLELFQVRNSIHGPQLPSTGDTRFRSGFGVNYKWLRAGTEIGQDLDGKWRPRVTAGVTIPLGNARR